MADWDYTDCLIVNWVLLATLSVVCSFSATTDFTALSHEIVAEIRNFQERNNPRLYAETVNWMNKVSDRAMVPGSHIAASSDQFFCLAFCV
jgi:hypothetical protein